MTTQLVELLLIKRSAKIRLFILIVSGFSPQFCGATVYVSDGSAQNVQYVHDNLAQDGDTITLPAGTFSWTQHVTITKGITIQGQTTTTGDHTTFDIAAMTSNDQTNLVDNLVRISGGQGFFHCTIPSGKTFRLTGVTFSGQGGATTTMYNGAIRFWGGSNGIRVDHCHFSNPLYHESYVVINGPIYGVMDHCLLDNNVVQMGQQQIYNGTGWGDLEWSQSAGLGGPNAWFFEDNYMVDTHVNGADNGINAKFAGRYVLRYSYLKNIELLNHGTELGRERGGRSVEV